MQDFGTSDNNEKKEPIKLFRYDSSNDPFIYRVAIITLSLIALAGVILIGVIAMKALEVPQAITAITSASIGALSALFSKR